MEKKRVAAIDIGSSSVRMLIAEITDGEVEIIDTLRQNVQLGKDSFFKGRILRNTINDCIRIINKFKNLCDEYLVTEIKAVATTAIREASNADIVLDNIYTHTGLEVETINATQETEYIHRVLTRQIPPVENGEYRCIAEVGSGTVEITIFDNSYIVYSTSLPIGALKAKQYFTKEYHHKDSLFANYLNTIINHELRVLKRTIPFVKISKIYGIGSELEHLATVLRKNNSSGNHIKKEELSVLCKQMETYSREDIIHRLNVSYDIAENFYAVSLIFYSIIKFFKSEEVYLPNFSLKECLIYDMAYKLNEKTYYEHLQTQIQLNSMSIGKSFNYDEEHALCVLEHALKLFEATKKIHRMGEHEKCYLIAASILHDVGLAISNRNHHKHSLYIIKSQSFYYFSDIDKLMIANIARYHRKSLPKLTHMDYTSLSQSNRMIVSKLAALLRIAESFEIDHQQILQDYEIEIKKNTVFITTKLNDDLYSILYSLNVKKDLFESFFGYNIEFNEKS